MSSLCTAPDDGAYKSKAPERRSYPTHDDELIDTVMLAAIRGVPISRVNKERLTGDGPPYIKDGHLVRYRFGDYRTWLASKQRFTSTSEEAA